LGFPFSVAPKNAPQASRRKATGALYYDSDGTGAHAQVQFATISNHSTAGLAYNDFLLI
jgi:Ca2+-binding RTX toxin-like protein